MRYTHDAWNRLVEVETVAAGPAVATVARYEYNGLHWRTLRDDGIDERDLFYYSSDWQVIEEHRYDYDSLPGTLQRVAQQFWGLRYIDDAVARRVDANADGDYVDHLTGDPPLEGEGTWFYLTDVQFSVVALTTETGRLTERVAYDAYGRARHRWHSDLDGDGDSDYADYTEQVAANFTDIHADPEYRPDADHNRDGDVDNDDLFEFLTGAGQSALTYGLISDPLGPDSPIGYDGYVFAPEAGLNAAAGSPQPQALGAYCARFRWYLPETGRWLQRDPAGYVDGMSLFGAFAGSPFVWNDPMGLEPRDGSYIWSLDPGQQRALRVRFQRILNIHPNMQRDNPAEYARLNRLLDLLQALDDPIADADAAECGPCYSVKDGYDTFSDGNSSFVWQDVLDTAEEGVKSQYSASAILLTFMFGARIHGEAIQDLVPYVDDLLNAARGSREQVARTLRSHLAGNAERPASGWLANLVSRAERHNNEAAAGAGLRVLEDLLTEPGVAGTVRLHAQGLSPGERIIKVCRPDGSGAEWIIDAAGNLRFRTFLEP